jgi:hypothetical protein
MPGGESVATESVTYYALRESDEQEATGLFRDRRILGEPTYLERLDANGAWVKDNNLLRYLTGSDTGAEKVSKLEAAIIARRLGSSIRRTL